MANQDYTASAIDLCNPPAVKAMLDEYHKLQDNAIALQKKMDALIPQEMKEEMNEIRLDLDGMNLNIRDAIEAQGSYQDVELGHYAVKQKRVSTSYAVEPFKEHYSQFVPAVVIETIDKKKLDGLVRGGLIQEGDLKGYGVLKEDYTYAFIIK